MITIDDQRHAGRVLRYLRRCRSLTQRQLAALLFIRHTTIGNRELGDRDISAHAPIDTARVLGYRVALIPARHAGARPTGTGWPA